MKKTFALALGLLICSSSAFATYIVVLRDGTRYKAKSKWVVQNGKALVPLENGTTLAIDPSLIDVKQTDATNLLGLDSNTRILATSSAPASKQQAAGLGSMSLKKTPETAPAAGRKAPAGQPAPQSASGPAADIRGEVLDRFVAAYENVNLYDAKVVPGAAPRTIKVTLTADTEEQVFNAISATSWLLHRLPGQMDTQLDMVELFMGTINGGSAGRFQMTPADAALIDSKQITREQYFMKKVIF